MMVKCDFCVKDVDEKEVELRFTIEGKTHNFCTPHCMHNSEPIKEIRQSSLSSFALNKTVFEFFAIITGVGGVYFTLFEVGKRALIMDAISVIASIVAAIIGVEHLRYVEEHNLVKRAVLFVGLTILASIIIFV